LDKLGTEPGGEAGKPRLKRVDQSDAAVTLAAPAAVVTITPVAEITVTAVTEFAFAAEVPVTTPLAAGLAITTVAEITVATGTTSATATTAATALVSTTAAATATVASATGRTSAAATAAGGIPAFFGFAHAQVPAAELGAIQLGHRRLAEFTARKGDEGKPAGSAGFTVDRHVQINDGFEGSEELAQFGFRSVVRQVSNIQFHRFSTSCRSRRFQAALPLSGKNA
jgi:hypothetical protein